MKKYMVSVLLSVGVVANVAHAEIVTNSAGKEIKLNPNKTWEYVNTKAISKGTNALQSKSAFETKLKNGNDVLVPVKVVVGDIDYQDAKAVSKEDVLSFLTVINYTVPVFDVQNRYSYIPRRAFINQKADIVKVSLEYTSQNHYGAEVVGSTAVYWGYNSETDKFELLKP